MRRPKGLGSVREVREGRWEVRFTVGGEPKSRTIDARTKTDAEKELRRLQREVDTGSYRDPSRQTVGEYLHKYLEERQAAVAAGNIRDSSLECYEDTVERHILPILGGVRLTELTALDIKNLYAALARTPSKRRSGNLAGSTRRAVHVLLKHALSAAVHYDVLPFNPCDKVDKADIPTVKRRPGKVLTVEQTLYFLQAAETSYLYIAVVLACSTGARRGEQVGYRWEDLDLDEGTIAVERQIVYTRGKTHICEPKTESGRRVIDLPAFALTALARHKEEQRPPSEWIIASPRHPDRLSHAIPELMVKVGLPRARLHDLRHGHATQLYNAGHDLKELQERLGHSDISTTANIYCHLSREKRKTAAATLDRLLKGHSGADSGVEKQ